MPQQNMASKHFLKPGFTSVKITAALATSGVVYESALAIR